MPNPVRAGEFDSLVQRIDYASATTQYLGLASPGTLTSASRWQVKRVTLDANSRPTVIEFANGTSDFTNVWDSRALYSYS